MTLREEIKEIIKQSSADNFHGPDKFNEETTDEILTLFEKLLDAKIQTAEMFTRASRYNPQFQFLEGRRKGMIEVLNELKGELKK